MPTTSTTGYTLVPATNHFIQWTPLWHIILVSVAAGCGLALAFGLVLLGTNWGSVRRSAGERAGGWVLGIAAGAFCIAAVALGVYVMCNPQKSKPLKVVPSSGASALVLPHRADTVPVG